MNLNLRGGRMTWHELFQETFKDPVIAFTLGIIFGINITFVIIKFCYELEEKEKSKLTNKKGSPI